MFPHHYARCLEGVLWALSIVVELDATLFLAIIFKIKFESSLK